MIICKKKTQPNSNFHKNSNPESEVHILNNAKLKGIIYFVLSVKMNEKKQFHQ